MKKALWRGFEGCQRHIGNRLSVKPLHKVLIPYARSHGARLSVDNFVKNFLLALDFEYSGMAHCTEIHTLKINILNEINGLRASFSKSFEKCTETTQLAVLVEYSAAFRLVLHFKCLSNPHLCSSPCLN
jgi:hypothetical protein